MLSLHYYILFSAIWSIGNGILHNIFVLIQKRPYEKELIRLLMDGHILIFAGVFYLLAFKGIKNNEAWGYHIAFASCIFLLGYCALIFKMLPSFGIIAINLIALVWLMIKYMKLKTAQ
jgi:uncharacterized membrane protein (UPF0136 family)